MPGCMEAGSVLWLPIDCAGLVCKKGRVEGKSALAFLSPERVGGGPFLQASFLILRMEADREGKPTLSKL